MSSPNNEDRGNLSDLLERLTMQTDSVAATVQGRAISRSEANLHLATSTGVVAIPISDILDVEPLGTQLLVSVQIADASKIRNIRSVHILDAALTDSPSDPEIAVTQRLAAAAGGGGGVLHSGDTGTLHWTDTKTVSGGRLDDTADAITRILKDDVWV